jgi:2-iminobutanoate/2-iminopropanoate deaminase
LNHFPKGCILGSQIIDKEVSMKKKVIQTDKAPKAIGPYSQAIATDTMVYTAGQIGLIPATGDLIEGGVEEQTRQALTNISAVLEAAGSSVSKVVKTTVFLKDMGDFPKMNSIYAEFFGENPPARSTIAVAGLPKGASVEIEAVALIG